MSNNLKNAQNFADSCEKSGGKMHAKKAKKMETSRGIYIVIEGQDGTGKSTQVEKLAEYFRAKFKNSETKFQKSAQNSAKLSEKINQKIAKNSKNLGEAPGKNSGEKSRENLVINEGAEENSGLKSVDKIGEILHKKDFQLCAETNLLLFTAGRNELWRKKIAPALEKNAIVISARNWFSSLAYQHFGQGISREFVENLTAKFLPARYLKPDFSFVLILDDETRKLRQKIRAEKNLARKFAENSENDWKKSDKNLKKSEKSLTKKSAQSLAENSISRNEISKQIQNDADFSRKNSAKNVKKSRENLAENDAFESRKQDFQNRVNAGYEKIAREFSAVKIDARGNIDEVFAEILAKIEKRI